MSESTRRRSTRARVPNKRYTEGTLHGSDFGDSSDEEGLRDVLEELEGYANSGRADDEFDAEISVGEQGEVEEEEDEDELEAAELDADEAASEEDEIQTEDEDYDHQYDGEVELGSLGKSRVNGGDDWRWTQSKDIEHNVRGLLTRHQGARVKYMIEGFGEADGQIADAVWSKWQLEYTLPTRDCVYGTGGFAYPSGFKDGIEVLFNRDVAQPPYFPELDDYWRHHGSEKTIIVDEVQQQRYLAQRTSGLRLVAGPHDRQIEGQLDVGQFEELDKFFLPSPEEADAEISDVEKGKSRSGWVFNVGSRVLSLAWAPVSHDSHQYLAVAVDQDPENVAVDPFEPVTPYPSSIQIWRFDKAKPDQEPTGSAEYVAPALARVICGNWGTPRRLKWCPAYPSASNASGNSKIVGSLAAVWTDGHVRVLEVEDISDAGTVYSLYARAAFEAKPPDTMCTCVDWIGADQVAVGCANGCVAIWNIASHMKISAAQASAQVSAKPWFFHFISDTYINDIVSAAPYLPHQLVTLSVSGFQQLTDIRNPMVENATTLRSRIYQATAAYIPHLQSFVSADETGCLISMPARRFFNNKRLAISTAGPTGGVMLATSPLHCCMLYGTPDGVVSCSNPVEKVLVPKTRRIAVHRWFLHEWRRARHSPAAQNEVQDSPASSRPGVARMSEGFKVVEFGRISDKQLKQPVFAFEPEQAVTAVAWNPNLEWGGWAAAGMGSGLLRVEDIAV